MHRELGFWVAVALVAIAAVVLFRFVGSRYKLGPLSTLAHSL